MHQDFRSQNQTREQPPPDPDAMELDATHRYRFAGRTGNRGARNRPPGEPGQQLTDASTADEWDISPKTANKRRSRNHSDGHTERPKQPMKNTTRKPKIHLSQQGPNRRETRTLGNKPKRRQPEGEPSCPRNRNRRRSAVYRIQHRPVRPRRKNNYQNQDKMKRLRRPMLSEAQRIIPT